VNPAGNRDVFPMILPDFILVSVELEKFVDELMVIPNKFVSVKVQLVKMVPVKSVPARSKDDGNVSDEYVFPWPITTIVMRSLITSV